MPNNLLIGLLQSELSIGPFIFSILSPREFLTPDTYFFVFKESMAFVSSLDFLTAPPKKLEVCCPLLPLAV